ncbi:MAG: hypothetical protein HS116_25585 [Planctomycetes bacterium]|nr:hypothetical protein [Planctomycetota bacterium]
MFAKNKLLIFSACAFAGLWIVLYFAMVSGTWSERETQDTEAQAQLERWLKYYKKGDGLMPVKEANQALKDERTRMNAALEELQALEFAPTKLFPKYTITAVGTGDPNNYFDRQRVELREAVSKRLGLTLAPGLDDLGFSGNLTQDPVPLNLLRLFVLSRFLTSSKGAGVSEVLAIKYPKPEALLTGDEVAEPAVVTEKKTEAAPAGPKIPRLIQVPLIIQLRAPEKNLARLLYELQLPSEQARSYFALRAYQFEVRDAASGLVDAELAVGALFPEAQYIEELKIPYKEDDKPRWQVPAGGPWGGY